MVENLNRRLTRFQGFYDDDGQTISTIVASSIEDSREIIAASEEAARSVGQRRARRKNLAELIA